MHHFRARFDYCKCKLCELKSDEVDKRSDDFFDIFESEMRVGDNMTYINHWTFNSRFSPEIIMNLRKRKFLAKLCQKVIIKPTTPFFRR